MERVIPRSMKRAKLDRGGITLVEALIGVAILSVAIVSLVMNDSSLFHQAVSIEHQSAATQSIQLLCSRIQIDFENGVDQPGTKGTQINETRPRDRIVLERIPSRSAKDRSARGDGSVEIEAVEYSFDKATHRILRNGVAIGSGEFEQVSFSMEPADFSSGEHARSELLVVNLVPRAPKANDHQRNARPTIRLGFCSPQGTLRTLYRYWEL